MPDQTAAPPSVILDVDGTLIDSNSLHVLAWLRAFRRLGHEVEATRVIELMGMGGDKLAPTILGAAEEQAERARALWSEEFHDKGLVEHAEALPGAVDFLRTLSDRGVPVALASSGEQEDVDRAVGLLGGPDACGEVVTSADVQETKPSPSIFAVALERLNHPATAVVIGDTTYDIEAARALGLPCIGVLTGGLARERLEAAGAWAVFADLTAVSDALDDVLASVAAEAAARSAPRP